MSDKTALWEKFGKTDPSHTKKFKRAGGFEGTAIKPMWSYKRMTEEFGPCGEGWGVNEPVFQVVSGVNQEVLVYCTASIWYRNEGKGASVVFGVGGDKIVTHIKANEQYKRAERWENDDEAFKKAFTDAVTNALKMIGVGADVHMGMFDDSKYVNTVRQEFEAEAKIAQGGVLAGATVPASQLKKSDAWGGLIRDYENDLPDVKSVVAFDKLAHFYLDRAASQGWPDLWVKELRGRFVTDRHALKESTFVGDEDAVVTDVKNGFGGRVVDEQVN